MANTQNITTGIKAIKISKIDSFGNDQTLQLQELNTLRIYFDDLGILNFDVVSIAEYSTYFLLYVIPTTIGNDLSFFKNPILPKKLFGAGTIYEIPDSYWVSGSSPHGVFRSYQTTTGVSGSLDQTAGLFFVPSSQTDPYTIQVTCSFDVKFSEDPFSTGFPIIVMMSGSYTDPEVPGAIYRNILGAAYVPIQSRTTSSFYPVTCSFTVNPGYVWSNNSLEGLNNYLAGKASTKISPVYRSTFGLFFQNATIGTSWSFLVQTGSINVSLNQLHTSSNDINGNLTVIEPYTIYNVQNSDYNAVINNTSEARFNDFFMDVDFNTNGGNVAVNQQLILDGKAVRAQVQHSNYTQTAQISPRYIGKELTSANYNEYYNSGSSATLADGTTVENWEGDNSYGKTAVIDKFGTFALTYRGAGKGDVWNGSGSATFLKIKYMFDESGSILQPKNNTPYYFNGIRQFPKDSTVNIVVTDSESVPSLTIAQLQGDNTIYNPFASVTVPLTTISGSFYQPGNTNPFGKGVSGLSPFTKSISITDTRDPVSTVYQAPYWFLFGTSSVITASDSSNWNQGLYSSSLFPYRFFQRSQSGGERVGIDPSPLDITPRKGQIMYFESQSNAYIIEDSGRTQVAYFTSPSSGSFTIVSPDSFPIPDQTFYKFTYGGTEYRFVITQSTAVNTSFVSGSTVCFGSGSTVAATANSLASAINTAFWSGSFYYSSSLPYALFAYTSSNIVLINTINSAGSTYASLIDKSTQNHYALLYNTSFNGTIFSSGSSAVSSSQFTFGGGSNTSKNTIYIKLNRPVITSSLNGLDQFVITDETPDMNKLWLNLDLTGSEPNVGAGYIYPEYISSAFETSFNNIIPNLPTF